MAARCYYRYVHEYHVIQAISNPRLDQMHALDYILPYLVISLSFICHKVKVLIKTL